MTTKAWIAVGAVVVGVGLFWAGCQTERNAWLNRIGDANARTAQADSIAQAARDSVVAIRARLVLAEGQETVDTVQLTKWLTRWREVRDTTVLERVDTLTVLAVADSVIGACTTALGSCQNVQSLLRQEVLGVTQEAKALDQANRALRDIISKGHRGAWVKGLGIGTAAGAALCVFVLKC